MRFLIEGMDVQCRIFFITEVTILNMSFGGVALSLNKRLNMGQRYTLKIESQKNTMSLGGVVVWEKLTNLTREVKDKKFPIYEAGVKFDEVLTVKGADLLNFLSGNMSDRAIKTRVQGLRVKIIPPEKTVILDDRDNYSVRMIGLGGMLIEGKEQLDIDDILSMEMRFPEAVKPIKFLGRTAYCVAIPDKTPLRYDTGIEFIQMNEPDRERLKEFIDVLQTV